MEKEVEISSTKNPRIKNLLDLQKPKERKEQQAFVVEGVREVSLAARGGFSIRELYICPSIYQADPHYPVDMGSCPLFELSEEVFSKVAYRGNTGGVVALVQTKDLSLANLPDVRHPLYLVLENVEKPGNIGAVLRTADAAGLNGVIVCDPGTDFYNPNVVRSSLGCLFTVPVASASSNELLSWLQERHIKTYAAALTPHSQPYHQFHYSEGVAFLLGAESTGLSGFWLQHADHQIIIPMRGKIDSMNVSNAAAILVFEAVRQRNS